MLFAMLKKFSKILIGMHSSAFGKIFECAIFSNFILKFYAEVYSVQTTNSGQNILPSIMYATTIWIRCFWMNKYKQTNIGWMLSNDRRVIFDLTVCN